MVKHTFGLARVTTFLHCFISSNHWTTYDDSVEIFTFADDTAVLMLITRSDESASRREVSDLLSVSSETSLQLNIVKTKKMMTDFRRGKCGKLPLDIASKPAEHMMEFKCPPSHLCLQFINSSFTERLRTSLDWSPSGERRPESEPVKRRTSPF